MIQRAGKIPDTPRLTRRSILIGAGAATVCSLGGCVTQLSPLKSAETSRVRRFYVDGPYGQAAVTVAGTPASQKTPLVLFHATSLSSDMFEEFMLDVGQDRLVIGIDTPGYGRSDPPSAPVSIGDYATAQGAVIDSLGLKRVDLLGYHTGTFIAAELAVIRPALVRRLVLPGIPYYEPKERGEYLRQYGSISPPTDDIQPVSDKWKFWVTNRPDEIPLEKGLDRFYEEMQAKTRYNWAYKSVFSYPSDLRLPQVTQPVLIPNTNGSLNAPSQSAAKLMQNAKVVSLDDIDRGLFDIHVQRIAGVTKAFLDAK